MSTPAPHASSGALAGNRLGRRLVRATLGLSLLIGLMVMLLQIAYFFAYEKRRSTEQLDLIGRVQVPQLASSLWLVSPGETGIVLDGIAALPGVAHIVLDGEQGERFIRGAAPERVLVQRRFEISPQLPDAYPIGTLEITIGYGDFQERLVRRTVFAGLTTLSALGACVLALLVLFRREVTRHLQQMAAHATETKLDAIGDPLRLDGKTATAPPDEIDQLVTAFNGMRSRIASDVERMRLYEAELAAHRDHLEGLVQVRTMELEDKARELEEQRAAVELLANTDALTGAVSRQHFHELGERELSRAARAGEPIAVMALDIDHFKAVNDSHGHTGGDLVLKAFTRLCQAQLRGSDVLGRLGGEEFAVLMPGSDLDAAMSAAERIRASVAGTPVAVGAELWIAITVSIGVASMAATEARLDTLLLAADEALYAAKRSGRNRAVASDSA